MSVEDFVGKKINITELALVVGCSRAHLSGVLHGKYKAGEKLAKRLESVSNGKFSALDIIALYKKDINNK